MQFHLVSNGIVPSYINWYYNGKDEFDEQEVSEESKYDNEGIDILLEHALGMSNID